MAEQIQETTKRTIYDDGEPNRVVEHRAAATDTTDKTTTTARVIWFITGAVVVLLAMRFGLSLLGANRGNAFADLIYTVSYPFAAPFFGLFGYQVSYGVSRFEIETLVAMAVYALVGYGLVRLVTINKPNREV